jgi:hypothetical protein
MAKKSKAKNPEYEDLATTYQVTEMALLNSVLKACGVANKRKRRKICEEFIFAQGVVFDEGAFQNGGKWYSPVISYSEREGNPDRGFGKAKKLYKISDAFPGYHEYALGNADYFFEKCKEKTDFDWGPEYE